MNPQRYILRCLPLLAAILGNKYGVKVVIRGTKAETDGNTIYIPQLPPDTHPETVALVRGYIDHEAAHVRDSDFAALTAANLDYVTEWLLNAIEDWRVERKLAESYPGCRQNMHWLAKRLFVDEQTGVESDISAPDILRYVLFTVRAWDVAEIGSPRKTIRDRLCVSYGGLLHDIDTVLESVRRDCPDTKAAIAYATKITALLKQWSPPTKHQQNAHEGDTTQGHENEDFNLSKQEETSVENDQKCHNPEMPSDTRNAPDSKSMSETVEERSCGKTMDECPAKGERGQLDDLFSMKPECLPASMSSLLESKIAEAVGASEYVSFQLATEGTAELTRMSDFEKQVVKKSIAALGARLQGLLQASKQQNCFIGRKGRLDAGKLYRVSVGNPKFCQSKSVQQALNTAVHIVLDASGSMKGAPMQLANHACYAIAHVLCQLKGINPAITAFHGYGGPVVMPILRHGQTGKDFGKATACGGTPLAPALWWVLQQMVLQRETRKIILILSDGAPDKGDPYRDALNACEKMGIEVYGLGIQSDQIRAVTPKASVVIDKLPELTSAVFSILSKALISEAA